VLIRNARPWPPSAVSDDVTVADDVPVTDVRITGDRISDVAPGLRPSPGEEVLDAEGAALLPGLHDHHIHLRALAAARSSVPVGPPRVRTAAQLEKALRAADAAAPPGAWLRGTGYHESVAGSLDRHALDRLLPGRPARVQHRTGALWILNSAAAAAVGLDACDLPGVERDADGTPNGRLWRLDRWLATRVPAAPPDLSAVSAAAAALGVTGFTDATPGASACDIAALAGAVADGTIAQRLHCMAPPDVPVPEHPRLSAGPVKIMLDDDTLPALDELAGWVRAAHAAGRPVAVHCVTRVQLILTLTALDEGGRHVGDRIEHGAIIPAETFPALRGDLTVVTQPHFTTERGGEYATDVDAEDLPDLWRLRSLLDAGLRVAAGSDAPFGGADPWRIAAAATRRPRLSLTDESVSPATALSLFFGEPGSPAAPRRITPGQAADLVLLRVSPRVARESLASDLVAATFVAGRQVR
jgi:predicted amidohydrolase YtcJ